MAKSMFYSAVEAAERLGKSESDLKVLVRDGKLREFRDGDSVNYKVDDVERLSGGAPAPAKAPAAAVAKPQPEEDSAAGEILLEPADDSSVELSTGGGSDILTLEEADSDETTVGARSASKAREKKKEGTAVPSVGVNVFDDDEIDEHVDPLAQTAVTDIAGMGLEGAGSGIMDLTRESDDTSLGRELLEEIYTSEEKGTEAADDTAAGTAELEEEAEPVLEQAGGKAASDKKSTRARPRAVAVAADAETVADPAETALTALLGVGVLIIWVGGLAAASLVRGVTPSLLKWTYANMLIATLAAVVVAGAAAGLTFFLSRRSR